MILRASVFEKNIVQYWVDEELEREIDNRGGGSDQNHIVPQRRFQHTFWGFSGQKDLSKRPPMAFTLTCAK